MLLLGGIVLNGVAGALYIGSQFGPGPRDGLMTGLARRTGRRIRLVRTGDRGDGAGASGWLLGGVVGVGTVLYALLIGPLVQLFLPMFTVRLEAPAPALSGAEPRRRPRPQRARRASDERQDARRAGPAQRPRRPR